MMRKVVAMSVAGLVCVFSAAAQKVIESESRIVLGEKNAALTLSIDADTRSGQYTLDTEFLAPDDKIFAPATRSVRIQRGKQKYKFDLPISEMVKAAGDEIAWYRFQYRIGSAAGIVSLSELMSDDFDLRAAAFSRIIPGETMRVRVRALNPFTEKAVKDVAVKVSISLELISDADEFKLDATAKTNGDGIATVRFKIPENIKPNGNGEIKITGQKNGVVRKIDEELDDEDSNGSVFLTTDKPLYQPGQTFNVRALYFDANNTVVANSELEFSIEDEDDTVVFRQTVKTSEFGIAAISWPIPDNAKLGSYRVNVDGDDQLNSGQLYFKVSRYDLPNFAVTAKPDKTYYLPTNPIATVTVSADYLFGKPVTKGKVRLVAESERHWNYRQQKYDVEEGKTIEGETDAAGKLIAKLDLKDEFAKLIASEWRRFTDLSFSAYFTDVTTNRTEQRRFDIRLTKEPIHIYLMQYPNSHATLPLTAYVSTFYADGTPAVCNVEISDNRQIITKFKTNLLGAGRFEIAIPKLNDRNFAVFVRARDKGGQTGTFDETIYLTENDAIQIRTDKAIYAPGETIEIDLISTRQNDHIYVDVVRDWMPVDVHLVRLNKGKAHLSIPYKSAFSGALTIAAYSDRETASWSDTMRAVRGVIFPERQNLIIDADFSKKEYRPGENATVKFAVADGSRKPVASAIGLGIFDKAIEERARSDAEFGGYFSRFSRLLGYETSFGNITLKDLNDLDLSRPVPPEMQLAAEIILSQNWYFPHVFHSGNLDTEAKTVFAESVSKQLKPVEKALEERFSKDYSHPADLHSLDAILATGGINFDEIRDPWGQPFLPEFSVNRTQDIVTLKTAGPDKIAGTGDDFTAFSCGFAYFTKLGNDIDNAVRSYHANSGKFIRNTEDLKRELARDNVDLAQIRDRWGREYNITFEVERRSYVIKITSLGPNGVYERETWRSDDFDVWKTYTDYFADAEREISRILHEEINLKRKPFPRNETEFSNLLTKNGLDVTSLKDGYGRSVYVASTIQPRFVDKTKIENGKTAVTPVTEELMIYRIRSAGEDGLFSSDDFDLATFSAVITEQSKNYGFAKTEVTSTVFSGAKGAIKGTVLDPNGAVIAGAKAVAVDESDSSKEFSAETNSEGEFLLSNLPSGRYRVVVSAQAFKSAVVTNIAVRSQNLVEIKVTLEVGNVSSTVDVTAMQEQTVNTTNSSVSTNITKSGRAIKFPYQEQASTPRLREYFPESLAWQPELVTDKRGKASFDFKMADNITTWKMFAIASTKKGKIGVVEKEITAFQPFFADLDPPKFLTEGDEIHLPTQVRNYTEKKQRVNVTFARADWFSLFGPDKQQIDVPAGGSQNAVFGFKAVRPVKDGKQRVTAIAQTDSDAIEKPVKVRPNGEEIVSTDSRYFTGMQNFAVNFPANALPRTQKAELKIYPNLYSHVAESVEGLLERPYGCGEQTISSTYPNLMILGFAKPESAIAAKAQKYLQKGYERLLGYQAADGGFTYWGRKDTSDVALTAYALRFLNDASAKIEVDYEVIKRAENWLIKQQRSDGGWVDRYGWETREDANRTKLTTTYVARSLAMRSGGEKGTLAKALAYLKQRNAEIDDPYAMALYGLASLDTGDVETANNVAKRLEAMAQTEGNAVYWNLETNTPFYGWGTAGRIETTALVVQLFTKLSKQSNRSDFVSNAMLFLLKNKDRFGVWYSTQTTINVLDAFLAAISKSESVRPQVLNVTINGKQLEPTIIASDRVEPVILDLTPSLNAETNSVGIRFQDDSPVMAAIVSTHYVDWKDSQNANRNVNQSRALRLDYKCNKLVALIMEDLTCSVSAERVGFQGYGMLLAEIGTPPGADISRESLERAIELDWSINRYEVLPDRIVVYMWAKAGGTNLTFNFRPRYGINAQTPASVVYDYYNPEARAVAQPLRFVVR